MIWAVLGSSLIAEPNIVASPDKLESRSHFVVVHDPAVGRVSDAVLQEHHRCTLLSATRLHDSKDIENVSIVCGNLIC